MTSHHPSMLFLFATSVITGEIILALNTTDPTIIATAVVTVISALVIGVVTVINAIAAAGERRDARHSRAMLSATTLATDKKADTLIEKAVEIHTLTNSNLSKVTQSLEIALTKIAGLEQLVLSMNVSKRVADDLATSAAALVRTTPVLGPAQPQRIQDEAVDSLKQIDKNTKAIESNTAKTDQTVQAMKDNGK